MADRSGNTSRKKPGESETVKQMLKAEKKLGIDRSAPYYQTFAQRASTASRPRCSRSCNDLKQQGKKVAAYGASAKGSTMLSYLGAGPELIEFVVDKNVHKHGKFMPGLHNPIYDVTAIAEKKPDYLVLLVWNLKDEILQTAGALPQSRRQVHRADPEAGDRVNTALQYSTIASSLSQRSATRKSHLPILRQESGSCRCIRWTPFRFTARSNSPTAQRR